MDALILDWMVLWKLSIKVWLWFAVAILDSLRFMVAHGKLNGSGLTSLIPDGGFFWSGVRLISFYNMC